MVVNVELRAGGHFHHCWRIQMQECGVGAFFVRAIYFPVDFLCPYPSFPSSTGWQISASLLTHAAANQKSSKAQNQRSIASSCSPNKYLYYQLLNIQKWRFSSLFTLQFFIFHTLMNLNIPCCLRHLKYEEQMALAFYIFEDYKVLFELLFFKLTYLSSFHSSFSLYW